MKLSVLLFAAAREIACRESVEIEIPDSGTVAQARLALTQAIPALESRAATLLWAVNNEYASDDRVLLATDAVACFPPVSGG